MFSQTCVKNSVHEGGVWWGACWQGGSMPGGGCAWPEGMHSRGRACIAGGGHAWQGCV